MLSEKGSKCYAEIKCQNTITNMALLTQYMTKLWEDIDNNHDLESFQELRNEIRKSMKKVEKDFVELKQLFKF